MSGNPYDDALRLRVEDRAWDDEASRVLDAVPAGAPALLVRTVTVSSYPTAAGVYYGVEAESVTGTESEGSGGSITPGGGTFYALNLGGTIPPTGTSILATFVGNRWVMRHDA